MDDEKRPARITEVLGVTPKGMAWLDQETARRREEVSVLDGPPHAVEHDLRVACARASDKAEGTLKEWGVV